MPTFNYKARTRAGEQTQGVVEASDRRLALMELDRQGLIPLTMEEQAAAREALRTKLPTRFRLHIKRERMTGREVLLFTEELSDLLGSGMTLGHALNSLAHRRTGGAGDRIIGELRDAIVQGAGLSEAMARHGSSFSNLYVSMIRAGEASGALADILHRLVSHYERIQETREKVFMAMVYPLIVMIMGALTLVFSMVWVVPKFRTIFAEMGQALPLPTRMLIGLSGWLTRYGWLVAIALAVGGILLVRAARTERGRRVWNRMQLRTPLIRGIIASGVYSNFARTLGTLLSNGVPIVQALAIVETTVGNAIIADEIHKARERVTDGTTISRPLAAGGAFPTAMIDMLQVGEQTGDMANALDHIARRYENELNRNIKIFTTALEPIMIVLVAVAVGFVAVSILMAVFSLTSGMDV